jgi:hypothetical protein
VGQGQGGIGDGAIWWVIGFVIAAAGIGGGAYLVYVLRRQWARRAIIRITALPPGEAPEAVRRAWVGLELPVIVGQTQAAKGITLGVLSRRSVDAPPGYAVEGRRALAALESASPEAAAWWRENAPDVLAPGYQLIFPAEVCERLDDLGS